MLSAWLDWYSIDARPIENEKFLVSKFLTKFFFHASFVFRIHMHCIVFLYLSCSFTVISLSVFTHNMHTLTKLDTQLDLKIDWLIFEFCTFSICYFLCVNWGKYIFFFEIWWIIIVQIFSLLDLSSKDHMFMGNIVSSLHILKERI